MTAPPRTAEILALDDELLSPATRIPFLPLVVRRGEGATIEDVEGRRFLDFHSMACVANTGHCHPRVVEAIQRQAAQLVHCNTAYASHEPLAPLAAALVRVTPGRGPKRVAFGLSGADANDGALKLVRAATGRPKAIAFYGSYHGNTYGALSLSAVSLAMRRGFGPVVPDIHHVPFPDVYRTPTGGGPEDEAARCLAALDELLATVAPPEEVAAVFLEPIQGDSGILEPPRAYLDGLVARCREHGILLVAEEVQSGIGRTGRWFASEHFDLEPDVTVVGKALGSGMPISAVVARAELMEAWGPPGHVFSTGASPVCCAAGNATIAAVEAEGLLERAAARGERLRCGLAELADRFEAIGDVRGRGLMLGVDLVEDRVGRQRARALAAKVLAACFARGLYLTFLRGSVLRLAPPLVLSEAEADRALAILAESLEDAVAGRVPEEAAAAVTGW